MAMAMALPLALAMALGCLIPSLVTRASFSCLAPANSSFSFPVVCSTIAAPGPGYASVMIRLLDVLQKSAIKGYNARMSLDTGKYKLYGQGFCDPKLTRADCELCMLRAQSSVVLACSCFLGGVSSTDECTLMFQDDSFW